MTSMTDDRIRAAVASPARYFCFSAGSGITLLAIKFLNLPISASSAWHTLAGGVLALAR
jgi:hypothetical protein